MEFDGDVIKFDIFDAMKFPSNVNLICALSVIDELSQAVHDLSHKDELETVLNMSLDASEHIPYVLHDELVAMIESFCQVSSIEKSEKICLTTEHDKLLPSLISPPKLDLKPLPENLKYVYLGEDETLPVIISSVLKLEQEEKLVRVLREHREAFEWTLADLKGLSPTLCTHAVALESETRPKRDPQRRLNPPMMQIVQKEILKWLDTGVIYPIADSNWVSPIHVVPKKGRIAVVQKKEGELIPTRV